MSTEYVPNIKGRITDAQFSALRVYFGSPNGETHAQTMIRIDQWLVKRLDGLLGCAVMLKDTEVGGTREVPSDGSEPA